MKKAIIDYSAVRFLQRNDLKDFRGRRNGAYHIAKAGSTTEGLCFCSRPGYITSGRRSGSYVMTQLLKIS